ncbi:MAG: phosphatidylglycerol lysyltransferase [Treponema sp.]|jgi:phosphoglucomutase|nr:phosphatidylglycerol lysyltransferase [Treponema sp.]
MDQVHGELTEAELDRALEGLILSASGWRGVFALSGDGESGEPDISPAHRLIAAAAARSFAAWLRAGCPAESWPRSLSDLENGAGPADVQAPLVILGTDTRPTGPALAGAVSAALRASGCRVIFAGVLAAPEIMAWARSFDEPPPAGEGRPKTGFIYISASHNPIGHNGLKFGLTDGGVLSGAGTALLIRAFKLLTGPGGSPEPRIRRLRGLLEGPGGAQTESPAMADPLAKQAAYRAYAGFSSRVVYGDRERELRDALVRGLAAYPVNIVCDFNGSARAASIDAEFLGGLGITLRAINGKPGGIAHRIVPEGESLEPCRRFLEECYQEDPSCLLGYMPDCDGDRGNLVVWDGGGARILEAQEVFALCCVAELAHLVWTGESGEGKPKIALAVNGPTSLRVDRIARAFGAEMFRAEVGEANVVGLARKLRDQGYTVRILGEGSAGGNITHPSAVRDPLDTLFSLLKLLCVREGPPERRAAGGFFSIWLSRLGRPAPQNFGLADIIASLPPFVTTGVYEDKAVLRVKTADHGALKDRYQKVFLEEWENRRGELRDAYGILSWEAAAYNGLVERRGLDRFGEAGRGGLKIHFLDGEGQALAAIWMRGSATEPVFRIMADVEGRDRGFEQDLIGWQRRMVSRADAAEEE